MRRRGLMQRCLASVYSGPFPQVLVLFRILYRQSLLKSRSVNRGSCLSRRLSSNSLFRTAHRFRSSRIEGSLIRRSGITRRLETKCCGLQTTESYSTSLAGKSPNRGDMPKRKWNVSCSTRNCRHETTPQKSRPVIPNQELTTIFWEMIVRNGKPGSVATPS